MRKKIYIVGSAKMARFKLAWVTEGKDWKEFIDNQKK